MAIPRKTDFSVAKFRRLVNLYNQRKLTSGEVSKMVHIDSHNFNHYKNRYCKYESEGENNEFK